MPKPISPLAMALSLLLLAAMAGMFAALALMVRKLALGEPILPPWPELPRLAPWGALTVVAVIATWMAVNLQVSVVYVQIRSTLEAREARKPLAARPAPAPAGKAQAADKEKAKDAGKVDSFFSFKEQMILITVINAVLLAIVPLIVLLPTSGRWRDLGVTSADLGRDVRLGVAGFLVVTPIIMGINALAQLVWSPNRHPLERMLREQASPAIVVLAYLSAVVLAPAAEELIFRGVFQGWLRKVFATPRTDAKPEGPAELAELPPDPGMINPFQAPAASLDPDPGASPVVLERIEPANASRYRRWMPIVLTSAFFAAVHYEQMPAPLAIFPLALTLGLLYERTESLVPSLVLHALFNGFNTTLLVAALLIHP